MGAVRHLVLVLGDQLDARSAAFDGFDRERDAVWMAEVDEEATYVWSHKMRLTFFFSAMRHFGDQLRKKGIRLCYQRLGAGAGRSLVEVLGRDVRRLAPRKCILVRPGDHRVLSRLEEACRDLEVELEVRGDRHFYCSVEEFRRHARGRRSLTMEFFYREMRRRHRVLLDDSGGPEGGRWNFDRENRESFGRTGPEDVPAPVKPRLDVTTREVRKLVETRFAGHPGRVDRFDLPVTSRQAKAALKHFIDRGLPRFGAYQDAMWRGEPFLFHSRLSAALNVKLLDPRECVAAAVEAWRRGRAPLNSAEGFIRQILGWREYIRGVYWLKMPAYGGENFFGHAGELPSFYWDGETDMACVRESMRHVLDHAYAHHIHRLMVLGNLALLLGVAPQLFHQWHMAMYADAIDWVSLPNALGMSQFADGGLVGSKPYCATGAYIDRMSNFCARCRYRPKERTGDEACPFSTLYWDFLDRHQRRLGSNPRMGLQLRNLERLRAAGGELDAIRTCARRLRRDWGVSG